MCNPVYLRVGLLKLVEISNIKYCANIGIVVMFIGCHAQLLILKVFKVCGDCLVNQCMGGH